MKYYKILNPDGTTPQGYGQWHLPKTGKPGKWMQPIKGELVPCVNGYHVLKLEQVLNWAGPHLYEVEVRGDVIEGVDKCLVRQARLLRRVEQWNEINLHKLSCDFAEHTLHVFEKKHPKDVRPRNAITTKRLWIDGKATDEDLEAARDVAGAAAGAAVRDVAWAAAGAAVRDVARAAAWAAVRDVAGAAAWDAVRDVAGAAEREWQNKKLAEYLGE